MSFRTCSRSPDSLSARAETRILYTLPFRLCRLSKDSKVADASMASETFRSSTEGAGARASPSGCVHLNRVRLQLEPHDKGPADSKGNELCRRERELCVDKCVNSCACPRGAESCPPRPSFSPSVSLFLARSVFPGYRSRFPPSSLFQQPQVPAPQPPVSRSPTPGPNLARPTRAQNEVRRSRRRRRPLWRLDRLGIGCRTRSPGCRAAPSRGRPHPALDQACVSLSRSFLFRAHATDGRVFKHSRSSRTRNKGF